MVAPRSRVTPPFVLAAVVALVAVWALAALALGNPILPVPWVVAEAFAREWSGGNLWEHVLYSAYRVVLSIIIAVILAAPAGMAVGQAPMVDRIASPLIYLIYPVPKIVLLPIIMLFLGVGEASKIFIISLILYFQILVLTRDAAYAVRPELILSVRSLARAAATCCATSTFPRSCRRYSARCASPAVRPLPCSSSQRRSPRTTAWDISSSCSRGEGWTIPPCTPASWPWPRWDSASTPSSSFSTAASAPGCKLECKERLNLCSNGFPTPALSGRVARHSGESAVGKPRNPAQAAGDRPNCHRWPRVTP